MLGGLVKIKELVGNEHELLGGWPWIINIKTNKGCIELDKKMTIEEVEQTFNPKDGDTILELRPLVEFTYTRENGDWYVELTGMGYA